MTDSFALPQLDLAARPSVADQVFDGLRRRILSLDLPPGAKISEVDVATQMGVSRQPVRDAFYRLSQLGFLVIRPQRATTVSLISERSVMRARFIRTAVEVETLRALVDRLTGPDLDALDALVARQRGAVEAGDRTRFHELDDQFHRELCIRAGVGFAWDLIHENKAHTDRVRLLSLTFASRTALDDHVAILEALRRRDTDGAVAAMRTHLGRIREIVAQIRAANHDWFAGDAE